MKPPSLILASTSPTRQRMLLAAGLTVQAIAPRVDEDTIRQSLEADGATPRDIADALAETKAQRISDRNPDAIVIGCDQVLEFQGKAWSKPQTAEQAHDQIARLSGQTHKLLSAVVLYQNQQPIWRHVATARLTMRDLGAEFLSDYIQQNWPGIGACVGGYKVEEQGIRLFSAIEGDHFTILGLPLLPLLSYLAQRGFIPA
jgi:septum formation protein